MYGEIFGGAAGGAATGASVGSLFAAPTGGLSTVVGGALGGLGGGITGYLKGKGHKAQKQSIAQARLKLEELARTQREQRAQDLQRAMSYFQPVQQEIDRLYG